MSPCALFLAVLLLVPAVFTRVPLYTMASGVQIAVLAIAALGLVPLTGHARQVSIGQAAFFGTGAYASALLTARTGLSPLLAAVVGVAVAAAVAHLIGRLLFRVEGHYLALATIGLGLVCAISVRELDVTGGAEGLPGVPVLEPFGYPLTGDVRYYHLTAGMLFLAVVGIRALLASRVGRSWTAVGDSPVAAAAAVAGIDVGARKRLAFVVAAALAAAAGSLYAHWVGYVDPSTLGLVMSLQLLIVATVGGLRTVWGAPVGAFVVVTLLQLSQEVVPRLSERIGVQTEMVVYGVTLVLTLLLLPEGVAGACVHALLRRRRPASPPDVGEPSAPGDASAAGPAAPRPDVPATLEITGLRVGFGGVDAVDGLALTHDRGGVIGLIGPNGAGKTTVLNVLSGIVRPSRGHAALDGRRLVGLRPDRIARSGVARTFQGLQTFHSLSVLDNVLVALEARHPRASSAELRARARALLAGLGLTDHLAARVAELPYGAQRRVELARALGGQPRLLLLDEPLAGLSRAERDDLVDVIRRIARSGVSVLLVEHDVGAVMRTCDRVVVLDRGRLLADGSPAEVRADERVHTAYVGTAPRVGPGPTSRPAGVRAAATCALEVHDLVSGYGRIEAVHGVSLEAAAGTATAIVGPNGAGKTTLLKTIAGLVPARCGRVLACGRDITAWSAEQRVRAGIMLVPEGRHVFAGLSVAENLELGAHVRRGSTAALRSRRDHVLEVFPRLAGKLRQAAGTLSGGEQQMLAIGRALLGAPRLLLLDEPSLGLSPQATRDVVDALARLLRDGAAGDGVPTTVVLVEQNAHAAFAVADRGYVLDRGTVALAGSTDELMAGSRVRSSYLGGAP